jgi:sulfoxide reductase heme-binding subunit YedZ
MSVGYTAISWNRQKRRYDSVIAALVLEYLGFFVGVGAFVHPNATFETLLIRGFGTAAFLLLHLVLCIGPLCRLNRRFLPLLYNRRHLGVTMFLLALVHGTFSIVQFHGAGDADPLVSVFTANQRITSLANFPFQPLGFFALLILFVMAATSHDFWLRNLTPPVWKRLHMMVYVAYGLLVGHVTLGALHSERNPVLAVVLGAGMALVIALHLAAAVREHRLDAVKHALTEEGFIEACAFDDIPNSRAKVICARGERIAIFRYKDKVSALSNVCRHQNGPLGEGRIIDGCVTCPWHGYQYLPENGCAPAPFTEKVSTFSTKIVDGRVFVDPRPLAPGTRIEPAKIICNEVSA